MQGHEKFLVPFINITQLAVVAAELDTVRFADEAMFEVDFGWNMDVHKYLPKGASNVSLVSKAKRTAPTEGMCVRCKEWTSVEDPCCGSGVAAEGSIYYAEEEEEEEDIT